MQGRWTLKYGLSAVLIAVLVIAVTLYANPTILPSQNAASASFLVMLTDPPTVPAGTTVLNLTYSDISIHVTFPNGTVEWLSTGASGTTDLFSLINMTQTLASVSIPINSSVDMIEFTISNVDAVINGNTYNVTPLSDSFVVSVGSCFVNQTLSGVLVDFNPTVLQIQATDVNGSTVNYYVLVPSAHAVVVGNLDEGMVKVGTLVMLSDNNRVKLVKVEENTGNVTISSASLSVQGNVTSLSVSITNNGNNTVEIDGLILQGEFNSTQTGQMHGYMGDEGNMMGDNSGYSIPFKVNGSSLVPVFQQGDQGNNGAEDGNSQGNGHQNNDQQDNSALSSAILQPGQSITLSFIGVISHQPQGNDNGDDHGNGNGNGNGNMGMVITPFVGSDYTIKLLPNESPVYTVTAAP